MDHQMTQDAKLLITTLPTSAVEQRAMLEAFEQMSELDQRSQLTKLKQLVVLMTKLYEEMTHLYRHVDCALNSMAPRPL